MNYWCSECWRLFHRRSYWLLLAAGAGSVLLAGLVIYHYRESVAYNTNAFYYSNLFGFWSLAVMLVSVVSLFLTGKDLDMAALSVATGVSRQTVFVGKFLACLSGAAVLGLVLLGVLFGVGESLLVSAGETVLPLFCLGLFNLLPILFSAFVLSYVLNLLGVHGALSVLGVLGIYTVTGRVTRLLAAQEHLFVTLNAYTPGQLTTDMFIDFQSGRMAFLPKAWVLGALVTSLALVFGYRRFMYKDLR